MRRRLEILRSVNRQLRRTAPARSASDRWRAAANASPACWPGEARATGNRAGVTASHADVRLLLPGPRRSYVNLRNFRRREWIPALDAAGVWPRRIYDLRSTFASEALAAGVSVVDLAKIMGTSVKMIECHYGALLQGSGPVIAGKLDAYHDRFGQDSATAETGE